MVVIVELVHGRHFEKEVDNAAAALDYAKEIVIQGVMDPDNTYWAPHMIRRVFQK
jgi:hypothetical protein